MLEGTIEIDETHLFSEKKSFAPHRKYALSFLWLLGLKCRENSEFLIIPIEKEMSKLFLELFLNT